MVIRREGLPFDFSDGQKVSGNAPENSCFYRLWALMITTKWVHGGDLRLKSWLGFRKDIAVNCTGSGGVVVYGRRRL